MARRVVVQSSPYYWAITVTGTGKPVTAYLPNGKGVRGVGATPAWFIRGVRELGDAKAFPCLPRAIDALAHLVETVGVRVTSGHRMDWASIEDCLHDIRAVARGDWERANRL